MKKTLSFLLFLFVFSCVEIEAKTLYVDERTGNDSRTYAENSESLPWATLGRAVWGNANRSTPNTGEAARAGDTVIVSPGNYYAPGTGTRFIPAFNPVNSGSAGNYITFQGRGNVYLHLSSSNGPVIGAYYKDYIIWDHFIIDEATAPPHSDTGPMTTLFSSNIIFRNSEVRGIAVSYIDNHNAIRLEESNNILVENNKLHGTKRPDDSHNAAAIMMYSADNVTVQNNEIYDSNAGIFPKGLDNANVVIRWNLLYNNIKGIRTSYSVGGSVYQNVIRDCQAGGIGIQIAENTRNYTFANNTIDNCDSGLHIGVNTGFSGNVFRNNLITNVRTGVNAGEVPSLPGFSSNHNNFYWNTRYFTLSASVLSLAQWRSASGNDMNSRTVDPQYANISVENFRLLSSSPLRNSVPDVLDLNGNSSTSDLINVGAYVTGIEKIGLILPSPSAPDNLRLLVD